MHHVQDASDEPMLDGLTVLDLSQGIAGPYCGMILRQQGARVIKVEPPGGDWSRQMGRIRAGQTAIAVACNAGKESVLLDARTESGRAAVRKLAERADVVIQNFRPGVAERMGVGYDALSARNPALVYVSISGYGHEGPMAALPAVDTTMQAFTGLMHLNRDGAGQPRRIPFFLLDLSAGVYGAQHACAALFKVARSGKGRHVRLSLLETSAALQSYLMVDDAMFPDAELAAANAPTGVFAAADGMLYVSMLNDAMFTRLARLLGCDDWLADAELHTSAGRLPRAAELNRRVAQALATQPLAHWEALLTEHDVLFARVTAARDLVRNTQCTQAGVFGRLPLAEIGKVPWANLPGMAGTAQPAGEPPLLGQHTKSVLAEFGIGA
ncbi:acyl-CoA transferase/carnitine dehydratase (plasmid) [Cupriavidus necator N-1]|uniref:Acyl-CoA transferase/carnitine dehydratase n=1 Tax=Cupriavidus necator (strain ATCC 43291 / DSM 13513 / CCUG 52238 / LMG 8453 / N-1) TaxID=1042878 RepID=F8GUB8_CUPNN|nr:CoA transferase [Cupriavidus necator]AEI82322.1 acyl-CoA transferase/carnitine dehydratase [Cupriavidus necator N-1]MDX6007338.1 CoA transferase [Cupriavidus necator]